MNPGKIFFRHLNRFEDTNRMQSTILTVVVTINTLVKPQPSLATPHKVKKPVLLLPAEPVFSVVHRYK